MDIQIGEISSTVRLVEGSDQLTDRIVRKVIAILADQRTQDEDARRERQVTSGVRDYQEQDF